MSPQPSLLRALFLYLAAGIGAFLVGFADLIRGGSASTSVTVLRITEVLRQDFSPALGQGWIALVFLGFIGVIISIFYQPKSQKESFSLGLSVFALLTAAAPYSPASSPPLNQTATSLLGVLVPDARAADEQPDTLLRYYVELSGDSHQNGEGVLLTLYNKDESELLHRQVAQAGDVVLFERPRGTYVLFVESKGTQRIRINLDFDRDVQATRVDLSQSSIPLSLQRLFRPTAVSAEDLSGSKLDDVISKYRENVMRGSASENTMDPGG